MKTLVDAMQADAEICNARMRANMMSSEARRQIADHRTELAAVRLDPKSKPLSPAQKAILQALADGRERTATDLVHKTGLEAGAIHGANKGLTQRGLVVSTKEDRQQITIFRLAGAE